MRSWLNFFVTVHHKFFTSRANVYLKSKGLKLDEWMEGVKNSRRADVLALYGLCQLTDCHCVVHLNQNISWSTLGDAPDEHNILMDRCEIHLCYMGNGVFVQPVPRIKSNEPTAGTSTGTTPVVIGSLTANETQTLTILLQEGIRTKPKSIHDASYSNKTKTHASASQGKVPKLHVKLRWLSDEEILRFTRKNVQVTHTENIDEPRDIDSEDSDSTIIEPENPLDLSVPSTSTDNHDSRKSEALDLSMQGTSSKRKSVPQPMMNVPNQFHQR